MAALDETPAPALAWVEQDRGERLALRVQVISSDPDHRCRPTLGWYKNAAREAFEAAAAHTEQPEGW